MKITLNKILIMLVFSIIFIQPANAYLDPGTGSYIIQVVIATFAGAALGVKMFWSNIKHYIVSIFTKKSDSENN